MWPLIIPPIVLVLSLGFLVWFLSRQQADPTLRAKLQTLDGRAQATRFWFIFPRDWWLRLLERLLQHLKLLSLKFHNRFQEFSNWLRRKREEGNGPSQDPSMSPVSGLTAEDRQHFWDRWHRRHRATLEETVPPIVDIPPLAETDEEKPRIVIMEREVASPSPLSGIKKKVGALARSETAQYFTRKKREVSLPPKKLLSEEELIDRIAKNPKDAVSYEELGDYYLTNENLEDAKACYRQVIKLSPLNREVKDKIRKLERLLVQREKHKG